MYYAHAICRRVNPAKFGDDSNDAGGGGSNWDNSVSPFSVVESVLNPLGAPIRAAAAAATGTSVAKAIDNPVTGPMDIAEKVAERSATSSAAPWLKGALIVGAIGVGGYALSQVAAIGKVIRG